MKTTKKRWGLVLITLIMMGTLVAQEKKEYKMFAVHEDVVMPSMQAEYEVVSKEFTNVMNKYKNEIDGLEYLAVSTDDMRYMFVWPIKGMADLDMNSMGKVREKMGAEKFDDMMSRMDKCYTSHNTYTIAMDPNLTYMPEGFSQTQEGMNYREFHYYYTTPGNMKKLAKVGKKVAELHASKNSQSTYRIYRSGFGAPESFFMVAISAKDPKHMAERSEANYKLLGKEFNELRNKALKYTSRFEVKTGWIRDDLTVAKEMSEKVVKN